MTKRKQILIKLPENEKQRIDDHVQRIIDSDKPIDNKSSWIRQAMDEKIQREEKKASKK